MSKPTHVYLDLFMLNDDLNPSSRPPALSFNENRNKSFLEGDASDYFLTIARFNIQTANSLPVFIPSILVGQPNVNKTVYSISILNKATGDVYTLNVDYVPPNTNTDLPTPPITVQDYTSRYYHIYNYQYFISMVSQTLITLWGMMGPTGPAARVFPFIEFNTDTYTSILNVNTTYFTGNL